MALDADDIKKLDEHIVEPLLQAVEALGDRIDGLGDRIEQSTAEMREENRAMAAEMRRSHEDLVERMVSSNTTLQVSSSRTLEHVIRLNEEILELQRRTLADRQKDDLAIDHRVKALEDWRAELEKKNGKT